MTEKRLYLDMDGTLAQFHQVDRMEELFEIGYFLKLEPNMHIIKTVKSLFEGSFLDGIYILSSVPKESPVAKVEKMKWVNTFLPQIDEEHMIFPYCGESKASAIVGEDRLPSSYYLLDDYNENLFDWSTRGGSAIKLLNGINNVSRKWTGTTVSNTENCLQELFLATV